MTHFKKLSFCSGGNLVTVELAYTQCNISDSQALFSCFVLYIKNGQPRHFVLWDSKPGFACSYLVDKFYAPKSRLSYL